MRVQGQPWIELAADRAHRERCSGEWPVDDGVDLTAIERALVREFPSVHVLRSGQHDRPHGVLAVSTALFGAYAFDPQSFDRALAASTERGALRLVVLLDSPDSAARVVQILTRAQPYLDRRNGASTSPRFDRVLEAHYALHDLTKPLVRADYAHALDVWQWTLRLAPDASQAVQVAALFHDVERLESEADTRIEQHAADYVAFKRAHAQNGVRIAHRALHGLGLEPRTLERALELVAVHESRSTEEDRALLNDADALSFFSLNSAGFFDHYGVAHTRSKVAYTLARLGPDARARLATIRLRADVEALLAEACAALEGPARTAAKGVGA